MPYSLVLRIGPTVAPALALSRRCFPRSQTLATPIPDMALLETKCASLRPGSGSGSGPRGSVM
ncbi:hypothetical protein B0H14DRAFT_3493731 [Mycena olivaceomarginata]|nr:hypothetical protein B0H14DRAFT_3493731 [Mycena olivaceomarginata]